MIGEGNQEPLRKSQAELETASLQDNWLMETREETAFEVHWWKTEHKYQYETKGWERHQGNQKLTWELARWVWKVIGWETAARIHTTDLVLKGMIIRPYGESKEQQSHETKRGCWKCQKNYQTKQHDRFQENQEQKSIAKYPIIKADWETNKIFAKKKSTRKEESFARRAVIRLRRPASLG